MEEDPVMMELLKRNTEVYGLKEEVKRLNLQIDELKGRLKNHEFMTKASADALVIANRLNRELQQLFSEVATMFELTTRGDIDGLLRARIQEALAGVAEKRKCVVCGVETGPGDPRCMQCLYENKPLPCEHVWVRPSRAMSGPGSVCEKCEVPWFPS